MPTEFQIDDGAGLIAAADLAADALPRALAEAPDQGPRRHVVFAHDDIAQRSAQERTVRVAEECARPKGCRR